MSARKRLVLDAILFVATLVAFFPETTGISVHEWLSLALVVPLLFHLVINWTWVVKTLGRFLEKLKATSRLNMFVDAALFVSAVTVMLSGLLVSQVIAAAFGQTTSPSAMWVFMHSLSAKTTILFTLVHLALHANWIARILQPRKERECAI